MRFLLRLGLLTLPGVALVLLAACSGDDGTTASSGSGQRVAVRLTEEGCDPPELTVPAGPVTFDVTNEGTSAVTEYEVLSGDAILGEVENVAPGLSGSFSVDLQPGVYRILCPNGTTHSEGALTVGAGLSTPSAASTATPSTVAVTLSDFAVVDTPASAPAGPVAFAVANRGPSEHELVVVKSDLDPSALAVDAGGDLDESMLQVAGEVDGLAPGATRTGTLTLQAGNYVLLCNLPGHYAKGMYAGFEVR